MPTMSILSSTTRQRLLECLYSALASPVGSVVVVSDVAEGKRKLSDARKDSGDIALSVIQIKSSPFHPDTDIWLIKRAENVKEESTGILPVNIGDQD